MNTVKLIGNVGTNVEIREVGGTRLASFSLATNETYTNKNKEEVQNTQWHTIKAWGQAADAAEKLISKGAFVSIQGKLNYGEYTNKDNQKIKTTEIVAFKIEEVVAKA